MSIRLVSKERQAGVATSRGGANKRKARHAFIGSRSTRYGLAPLTSIAIGEDLMISSNVFRFLAVAGALCLGTLPAPAQAAVFQASTTVSLATFSLSWLPPSSLPQYSGPGTIVGVNIELSGSASGGDLYDYFPAEGITVESYSRTWSLMVVGPPNPFTGPPFLDVDVTAEYQGGSIPPCPGEPICGFPPFSLPTQARRRSREASTSPTSQTMQAAGATISY